MARKNSLISVSIEETKINFAVEGVGTIELFFPMLSAEIREQALYHGLVQKVSDAAALSKNKDGTSASAEDKYSAMQAVVDRLVEGDWNKRVGSGEAAPVSGLIFRAFLEFATERAKTAKKPIPAEAAVKTLYDGKSRADQLALRNIPEIATIVARIKSERGASSKINTEELVAELDGL